MGEISELEEYLQEMDIHELIQKLRSPHAHVRSKARQELVRMGDRAILPLIAVLHEANRLLACEAVLILNEMTGPQSPHSLVALLENDKPMARWDSTKALIRLERGGIMALLEALVKDYKSIYLQDAARDVLKALAQEHYLTGEEERVLAVLEGFYPKVEVAHAAQAALDALKDNSCPDVGRDVSPKSE
jgi:HEAT repeat protein